MNIQEDVERRTVAISVNATKLTGRVLAKAFQAVLRKIQKGQQKAAAKPQGRQSVKKLTGRFDAKNIPFDGNNEATRLFDRVIKEKKLKVDYAFYKTGPKKYLLFFKAGHADAITAAFSEYTKRVLGKSRQPSIREQLRSFAEKAHSKPRQRERTKEAVRNDR